MLYLVRYNYFETVSALESKQITLLDRRIVQSFTDIIILTLLENSPFSSGYDVLKYFHRKYRMLSSSGTIYSVMYSMERQGLVEGRMNGGKRVYELTDQGKEFLEEVRSENRRFNMIFSSIFQFRGTCEK